MVRGDGLTVGVAMESAEDGETLQIRTVGSDEVPLDSEVANHTARELISEAIKAGVRPPAPFILGSVQVFYQRGRPVEARMSGYRGQVDHYADDGQPVWLFPPWSTEPAPQWAEDGGMLAADAGRTYQAARNQLVADGAELRPMLRRWWNLHEHSPQAFVFWRDLADLAESEADFPEALQSVTRFVLGKLKEAGDAAAGYALSEAGASWRDKLVRRVKARLAELRKAAGLDGEAPPENEAGAEVTGTTAAWMAETFAKDGKESAEDLRERAKSGPWIPWCPEKGADFAFVLRRLARLVWQNEIEAEAGRADARRPALVRAVVMDELVAVQTGQLDLPTLESRELRAGKRIVATIDAGATDLAVVRQGIHVLRTVTGHRLVKDLVLTAHRQYEADGFDPRAVEYPRGWSGLAEAIGYSTGRGFSDLRALAEAGRFIRWQSGDGGHRGGGWWMWSEKRGGPGVTGRVRFVLNDPLLPGYASALGDTGGKATTARAARRLVPELPHEPPMGALHDHYHGAAWSLHRLVLVYLVDRAEELAERGLVVVTKDRWEQLAERAGLPLAHLPKLLESWEEDESEKAPALIARDGDGLRLADPYAAETAFIVEAGRKRIAGRKGGRSRKAKG